MNYFEPPKSTNIPECPDHGIMDLFDSSKEWEHYKCNIIGCDFEYSDEPDDY